MQPSVERTKDRLLFLLKTRGPQTTKALARALGVSVPAVRRHLETLGDQVSSAVEAQGVGRPAHVWRLGEAAQARFPDTHAELTVQLLDTIEQRLGREALDSIIDARQQQAAEAYRQRLAGAATLGARLKRLVAMRSEEGYMATLEKQADGWLLIESHCPICAAAERCQSFCRNELETFRALLGDSVSVERVAYLLGGDSRCAYSIRQRENGAPVRRGRRAHG